MNLLIGNISGNYSVTLHPSKAVAGLRVNLYIWFYWKRLERALDRPLFQLPQRRRWESNERKEIRESK